MIARVTSRSAGDATLSPDERLRRLVALHADGLVSDAEFQDARARIVTEL